MTEFYADWSVAEDATLRKMFGAGVTIAAIGGTLRRSEESVTRRVRRLGLERNRIHASHTALRWPERAIGKLQALLAAGRSYSQIAAELGKSRSAVSGMVDRLRKAGAAAAEPGAGAAQREKAPAKVKSAPALLRHLPLEPRPAPAAFPPLIVVEPKLKPASEGALAALEKTFVCKPMTIVDLEPWHCHWIVSPVDGANTLYCGAASTTPKSPYCTHHRDLGRGRGTVAERRALRALLRQPGNTGAHL